MPAPTRTSIAAFLVYATSLPLTFTSFQPAHAACVLTPTVGNDVFVCDSGTSVSLTDTDGSNTLSFPAGGTGAINGNVTFGSGNDRILMNSGTIVGTVIQGDGTDTFEISAGTVTGAVSQGSGIDDFVMLDGRIQSLAQGDGLDTFFMSGGTIVGAFEDGDVARMTGGTIGRVDMKLDDNLFDMSGGTIQGNLVAGFGNDTIIVSGGTIGGNISISGGDDQVTVSGGQIAGEVRTSFGNDTFTWTDGGLIKGAILLGEGSDTGLLHNLGEATLSSTPSLDGGLGDDRLSFDNSTSSGAARYINWESVTLANSSRLDLAGDLVLGDATSATGSFAIDGSSTLAVSQGSIRPFAAGQLVNVSNAGLIDMTAGGANATDSLTVVGNYLGDNGRLQLQSVLAGDDSPADKLVIAQGTATGNTQIAVSNLDGLGGLTQQNGILLVEAVNGASTDSQAFSLQGSVSAGAYEYYLFKGGVSAGSENSWYLRSSVVALPTPVTPSPAPGEAPEPPVVQPALTPPVAALGTPPLPTPAAGAAPIPLYRVEVPVYSVVPPAASLLALISLGTFHKRQGEQSLLGATGAMPAGWGRAFGRDTKQSWSGTVEPSFDGSVSGFQVGHDLYGAQTSEGRYQRAGFFIGHARMDGDIDGFALGFRDRRVGDLKLDGDSLGAYWTLTDPTGWYLDAVAMGTRFEGRARSERGFDLDIDGNALTLSLEGGYPIALSSSWVLEPQAQLITQHLSLDDDSDPISAVSFDSQQYWTGRLGARLKGRYELQGMPLEPYLRANLWKNFGGYDTVEFDQVDRIKTEHESASADIGAGLVATLSSSVSLYVTADYSTNIDSHDMDAVEGNIGLRVSW